MFEELKEFVDYLKQKGLLNPATARTWHRSVELVEKVADAGEAASLDTLEGNIDDLFIRYANKYGNLSPRSLKTYQGAFRSVLREFRRWEQDKINYKPSFVSKRAIATKTRTERQGLKRKGIPEESEIATETDVHILRIALSDDKVADIRLPKRITKADAALIKAMVDLVAKSTEQEKQEEETDV